MEWLSNISQPAVDKSFLFKSLPDMVKTIISVHMFVT